MYLPEGDRAGDEKNRGNTIEFDTYWVGDPSDLSRRFINVRPQIVSREIGINLNSGTTTDPDFMFDDGLNGLWRLPADQSRTYNGVNASSERTRQPYLQGERVRLVVSSYDWGGTMRIQAQADGCAPSDIIPVPQDVDRDTLPDRFEDEHTFWTSARRLISYNKGAPRSDPGMPAGQNDGSSDQDLDDRAVPLHGQFGDGLTAYEEYRGVTVRSVSGRLDAHRNDGPANGGFSGEAGGPHVKDLFIFDGKSRTSAEDLFRQTNPMLTDYKLIWHKILKAEMKDRGERAGEVNFNSRSTPQNAVWIVDEQVAVRGQDLLGRSTTSVRDGVKVFIDVEDIRQLAVRTGGTPGFETLLNWVVAHELGHKLSRIHPAAGRTRVAVQPAEPNVTNYGMTGPGRITFWMPRTVAGRTEHDLEFALDFGGRVPTIVGRARGADVAIHGRAHPTHLVTLDVHGSINRDVLQLEGHLGFLLDPVVELEAPQSGLRPEDRPLVKIKN